MALVGFVGLCLLISAANVGVMLVSVHTWYLSLTPPPLMPPNAAFAPIWNALYVLIGFSAWLVWLKPKHKEALRLWGWQLLATAIWPTAFFGFRSPLAGFIVLLVLCVLIAWTIHRFARVRPVAAWLMAPYLLWSIFAAYLDAGF